ncbi:hypothetical protein [Spirosoma arcticum]
MIHRIVFSLLVATFSLSCVRNVDIIAVPTIIDPNNPNQLSRYVVMPDGTLRIVGVPPAPNGGSQAPQIRSIFVTPITASNGGVAAVSFQIPTNTSSTAPISGYYVQIQGSDSYFNVPVASGSNPAVASIPIQLPANTGQGRFCVNVWAYDASGRVSSVVEQCVEVLQLGTGDLQTNLTWDTDDTDVDLYVQEPSGNVIYYSNDQSASGGELDRDDTDGFGPENIYWTNQLPDGEYKVWVEYYSGGPRTNFFVTINAARTVRSYTGFLTREDERKDIVTIRKQGDSYTFSN